MSLTKFQAAYNAVLSSKNYVEREKACAALRACAGGEQALARMASILPALEGSGVREHLTHVEYSAVTLRASARTASVR